MNAIGSAAVTQEKASGRLDAERLVALAFAGSEMVMEADSGGRLTFAAGAFRATFGAAPETFVGRALSELVAPVDHDALDAALSLLVARGRVFPFTIRLSDAARTPLALAGIAIPGHDGPPRLCLSLARLPATSATVLRPGTGNSLVRAAAAWLRAGTPCAMALLEVSDAPGQAAFLSEAVGVALETVAPDGLATEVAPGRFGVLGLLGTADGLRGISAALEVTLRDKGLRTTIAAHQLDLTVKGLTTAQAARALRQALHVFAQAGADGLARAGFEAGLTGYMRGVGARTGAFRRAIHDARFGLLYQPIVTLADDKTHHVEALIRPEPIPECAISGPQEFVGLVETLGLADELDLAVAGMACAAAARSSVPVAFNISGQSVQSPVCRERLLTLLADSAACRSGNVLVEITETAEIEDFAQATELAAALRGLGVAFCLDDFGAGTTDVRLLRALRPDIVKLDGSYIPGISQEGRERALVAGMAGIARAVGAMTIAEHVETRVEADVLRDLGVECGQGWLFGRPGPLPAHAPRASRARRAGGKEAWG